MRVLPGVHDVTAVQTLGDGQGRVLVGNVIAVVRKLPMTDKVPARWAIRFRGSFDVSDRGATTPRPDGKGSADETVKSYTTDPLETAAKA